MAKLRLYAGENQLVPNGSGIGFYGNDGIGSPIAVGGFNGRTFVTDPSGTIHGFAGIAHFILFLPILGFSTYLQTGSYMTGFAVGTIIAMVSYAFILGKLSTFFISTGHENAFKYLRIVSGILAIVVGIYWMTL